MKFRIFAGLLLSGTAVAQSADVQLSPAGMWPWCQSQHMTAQESPFCAVDPGREPYILLLRASRSGTVAFRYSVAGVGPDGQAREAHGVVAAAGEGMTAVVLTLGVVSQARITVTELSGGAAVQSDWAAK